MRDDVSIANSCRRKGSVDMNPNLERDVGAGGFRVHLIVHDTRVWMFEEI
jgi:hypothetical protein